MSKTTRKFVASMSCAAMLLLVLAGCGSKAPDSGATAQTSSAADTANTQDQTTAAPAEKVTLKLLIDNQTDTSGIKAEIEYIEKTLNIATEIDLKPGGTEGDNVMKTRLATGDMDDLSFYNSGSLFQALNPEQNFVDLTNEPFMANIMDSFKTVVSYNGKVYGIPGGSTLAGAWLYNKKIYSELGLSVPKTWNELMANCEKIKAVGKTAVIGSYKDTWTSQLLVLADYYNVQAVVPGFADDYTANKVKYATTPAALRGFEKLQDVFKNGYMNKDFLATTYDVAQKMIAEGEGVHYPMLTGVLTNIEKNYPDKVNDIGVFPQPSDDASINGLTVWMPAGIYLYKNGKNVEAAKKWAEAFVSPEGTEIQASKVKPVGPFLIKGVKLPEDSFTGVKDMLPYFDSGKTAPALEFVSPVKGPSLEMITVEAGSGIKAPLDCAKEYDKDVEKQAKQLGLAGW